MTYKEALAEIIGKDHENFNAGFIGGVYDCPGDAFKGVSAKCPVSDLPWQEDRCHACWAREYHGEEFNPEYLEG